MNEKNTPSKCPNCNHILDDLDVGIYIHQYQLGGNQEKIFRLLFRRFGSPVQKNVMFDHLYWNCPDGGPLYGLQTIDTCIRRIRAKMQDHNDGRFVIRTEHAFGYSLQHQEKAETQLISLRAREMANV